MVLTLVSTREKKKKTKQEASKTATTGPYLKNAAARSHVELRPHQDWHVPDKNTAEVQRVLLLPRSDAVRQLRFRETKTVTQCQNKRTKK